MFVNIRGELLFASWERSEVFFSFFLQRFTAKYEGHKVTG